MNFLSLPPGLSGFRVRDATPSLPIVRWVDQAIRESGIHPNKNVTTGFVRIKTTIAASCSLRGEEEGAPRQTRVGSWRQRIAVT